MNAGRPNENGGIMTFKSKLIAAASAAALISLPSSASAQRVAVSFGDNSSTWANDGECDDPRFEGNGMASTLIDQDLMSDANDCRTLYNRGQIRLRAAYINWGDNSSTWAYDGECDDPRFRGSGMATTLLAEDELRDATDCRNLYEAGRIQAR